MKIAHSKVDNSNHTSLSNQCLKDQQNHLIHHSIDGFPQNVLYDNFFTEVKKSTKVTKRNTRQQSFNYNHNTETSFVDKINNSNQNSFSKGKEKVLTTQMSASVKNKPEITKIPFQKRKNLTKTKGLLSSKIFTSKDLTEYLHTSSYQTNNKSTCLGSNQCDGLSLGNSSDNNSARSNALNKTIQEKLNKIQSDIISLINMSNDQQKLIILKEFHKIYKGIISNTLLSTDEQQIISSSNTNRNLSDIEVLRMENASIKEENKTLNHKVKVIEDQMHDFIKEKKDFNAYVMNKLSSLDDIKQAMKTFNDELIDMKKEGKEHKETNDTVKESMKKHKEEHHLVNHINLNHHTKHKKNMSQKGSNNIIVTKVNSLNHYNNHRLGTETESQRKNNDYESMDDINLTENNTACFNRNMLITRPNQKLQLKLIPKASDFNSEFLENYEDFSPSWRKDADKMLRRKGK